MAISSNPKKRPNVVISIADDQNPYALGFLGRNACQTPFLDQLVQRGCYFPHTHHGGATVHAVCTASRAMLMTGMPIFGIPNVMKGWWEEDADLFEAPNPDPACMPLLGEILRRQGYRTFGTGKWHNMPFSFIRSFNDGGAIYFCGNNALHADLRKTPGMPAGGSGLGKPSFIEEGGHYNKALHMYDPIGEYPPGACYLDPRHSTEAFCEAAVRFLDNYDGDDPFFLYVPWTAPHNPLKTDDEWHAKYDPATIDLPENYEPIPEWDNGGLFVKDRLANNDTISEEQCRERFAAHYALTTHMDDAIRRIYEALERNGFLDDTYFIHTGDHGKQEGNHGMIGKQSMFEEAVTVPFILTGPDIPQGEQRDQLIYQHDLFPTILEWAGAEIPETTFFESLSPALADGSHPGRQRLGSAYKAAQRMMRDERYKYIAYGVDGVGHQQLFDLENDPHEMTNLVDQPDHAERVQSFRESIRQWQVEAGDPCDVLSATA